VPETPKTNHGNFPANKGFGAPVKVNILVHTIRSLSQFVAIEVDVSRTAKKKCGAKFCRRAGHRACRIRDRQPIEKRSGEVRLHLSSTMRDDAKSGSQM